MSDRFDDMTAVQIPRDTHKALKIEAAKMNLPLYEVVDIFLRKELEARGVYIPNG